MTFKIGLSRELLKTFVVIVSVFAYFLCVASPSAMTKKEQVYLLIAKKVWRNEAMCKMQYLSYWSKNESFASLGIGHFLWFPKNYKGPFTQTFPEFVKFADNQNASIPRWLLKQKYNPWSTRQQFYAAWDSQKAKSLRQFLVDTIKLQARYLVFRFEQNSHHFIDNAPSNQKKHVEKQLQRMLQTQHGLYPLIDYTNFKGTGFNKKERYATKGWGLLQVLEHMQGHKTGHSAILAFVTSAQLVLTARVKNSPPQNNEKQWLAGWIKRLNTYSKTNDNTPCSVEQ